MRTINFVTHIEGLNFSFNQDDVGNRTYTLDWEKEGKYYVPENFDLEDDEEAKKFLHGLIDGFFDKRIEQAEKDEFPFYKNIQEIADYIKREKEQ